ncbi:MAG: hypothetical protein EPN91_05570 [Salinibacterium sp.]|nr:MAG: hypothetical protein EPN91_05570 [Salinibacterium sp.]
MTTRRSFITGLVSFAAAPAIVRVGSIMPVKVMEPAWLSFKEVVDLYVDPPGFAPDERLRRLCAHYYPFRTVWDSVAGEMLHEQVDPWLT